MQKNDLNFLMQTKFVIKFESNMGILSSIKNGKSKIEIKYQIRLY